ncbi:molybdopterin-dependent oxidoreductase [Nocardioides sp. SYSU D00038]|uniref:molybdopterin-dependent oxidoreductase n=1 Tax=Nocardioides sp. SYSU D00038 TaxID=2812554 RepID=UPI0027DBA549|nr:molybdopterin-dependent oxidoreductase [Nocardioides sp. SYSU D00038]
MSRLPVPREDSFGSRLRSAAVAARVGLWLGVCFTICFATGLLSHYAQNVDHPIPFPTSPSWGYRLTQGLHVTTGTAAVPLLLVKLWAVYPKLFARPPRGLRRLAVEGLERASIAVLVATAIFQLASGLLNSAQWYPWAFSFRATHYALAWVAIGALVVHVAVKLPVIRAALGADVDDTALDRPSATRVGAVSRRGLLRTTWLAAGVAVLATAGSSVPLLRRVSVLGVRSGDGPGGVPVNKSARAAGVTASATSASYVLEVVVAGTTHRWSRDDLLALPQRTETLPIACVEGWSAEGTWTGVRLRDLLDLAGAPAGADVEVTSLQESGPFRVTRLQANFADDDRTLLALGLAGEPLSLDHGYPARVIAPNRPGVLQTKWVRRLEVLA